MLDDFINHTARQLAVDIFEIGDEPESPCYRIQFMGGEYPDNEKSQGGMNDKALTKFLEEKIRSHLITCVTQ